MLQRNFLVWLLASLFYAYQYILRVIPNIIAPELITKFNISITDVGQFGGLYYVGYTLAHIPIGLALDKFGPKFVLPICIILTFTGTLPLICFDEWYYSILGRIVVGIGSSASAIGLFKVASMYFAQEKSARMASLSIIIGILGGICGGLPLDFLLDKFGWNYVIYTFSAFGCLLALLLFLVTPESNAQQEKVSIRDLKNILFNKHIILISFFGGLMVGPMQGFADGWVKTFFFEVYKMNEDLASSLSSVILIGMLIGSFSLAYLLEKYKNKHYEVIIACSFAMIASFLLLFTQIGGLYVVLPTLFIIGFTSGYQVVTIYKAISYVNNNLVGLATAVSNMIVMVFGYFFHTGIAKIVDLCWDRTIIQGNPVYGAELLIKATSVIPVCLLVAVFGLLWLKNKDFREVDCNK
ncbi:MFS transporter [Wolbachia pipientis]|nr:MULTISPECIES: MFS transporter [unclassified Wolbachia]EAL59987.1 permease, putative [Wolbachia endosymbiont of Drosophila simulans]ACN95771.1 permease, putative [Wolbachia sp. wRi]QEF50741.1 major Facilitator Superfamily protein [Wolbachia endosymbiont of Drosophila ananassae]RLT60865.1 major Facilitator Superfamily protein [Wolbachia endosymbiont of Drosophila ananassae]RLT61372.1 major Facilitator Superfamily protein [Wolbachia endosymbiont of Drosophila ananassae]